MSLVAVGRGSDCLPRSPLSVARRGVVTGMQEIILKGSRYLTLPTTVNSYDPHCDYDVHMISCTLITLAGKEDVGRVHVMAGYIRGTMSFVWSQFHHVAGAAN